MIKRVFKWLGILIGIVLLLAGSFAAHEWNADKPFYANNFYNRAFLKYILKSPEQLTSMGMLEQLGLEGLQSLTALANLIKHRRAAGYDMAVRAWAIHDDMAWKIVKEADKIRLAFIRKQFEKIGFKGLDLENRCRLYLYYAMTEPAFFNPPDKKTNHELDKIRLSFLTTP